MNIFVYGDESGVFDKAHNKLFVFGGLVFLDKDSRDVAYRKYISAEKKIASLYKKSLNKNIELKASILSKKHKSGLFRSTNNLHRYAFVVNQDKINNNIFNNKKSKQRYLDYVFKVGLKRTLEKMINNGSLKRELVQNIYIRFDEHTTATDGRYELKEGIEQEFKHGTFNYEYTVFHPPLFPNMKGAVELQFRDSQDDALIRASDIIANHAYFYARNSKILELKRKMYVVEFP